MRSMHGDRKKVSLYIEGQGLGKVISAKEAQTFNELDYDVRVWNVKTDKKESWWVVEGDTTPMNYYTQDAFYFTPDEVYSLHMGVMWRIQHRGGFEEESIFPDAKRKLQLAIQDIETAEEAEHFQSVGLKCREALITLGLEILIDADLPENTEMPKAGDFKGRAQLAIDRMAFGPENSALRASAREMSKATWDLSASLTHSSSSTKGDAAICLTFTQAVFNLFQNLFIKYEEKSSHIDVRCPYCKSRRLYLQTPPSKEADESNGIITCLSCHWKDFINLSDE